ncbi:GNAT family N-acetyltransferase [Enterovibrio sp. ZSDZ35]|uniref:GNAT family N-acetyltransferase n=1 Tax=Enterovibrio qingdaonensis TaxID=2899818 RepID=A0ABT5QH34_9GAMM|nr:GNAT family N-acetyltransferase [Enterovibrio sp. ZSDZ35]MDD1780268.1 GNAT family N-acetyltransferase [Enterovibrio sp. ZSDZ35]
MLLVPFTGEDAPLLCGWIQSAEQNVLWGGPTFEFPLTELQVKAHLAKPEISAFLLVHEHKAVGYVELYKVSRHERRLCRVLVADNDNRGKGWGKQLVSLALGVARENSDVAIVSLAVFEQNHSAVHCYRSLGFECDESQTKTRVVEGNTWVLLRMIKHLF